MDTADELLKGLTDKELNLLKRRALTPFMKKITTLGPSGKSYYVLLNFVISLPAEDHFKVILSDLEEVPNFFKWAGDRKPCSSKDLDKWEKFKENTCLEIQSGGEVLLYSVKYYLSYRKEHVAILDIGEYLKKKIDDSNGLGVLFDMALRGEADKEIIKRLFAGKEPEKTVR
jgi:hypothetical protein